MSLHATTGGAQITLNSGLSAAEYGYIRIMAYPSTGGSGFRTLMSLDTPTTSNRRNTMYFFGDNGIFYGQQRHNDAGPNVTFNAVVSTNGWDQYGMVVDAHRAGDVNQTKIFPGSLLTGTRGFAAGDMADTSEELTVINVGDWPFGGFQGYLAEIAVWAIDATSLGAAEDIAENIHTAHIEVTGTSFFRSTDVSVANATLRNYIPLRTDTSIVVGGGTVSIEPGGSLSPGFNSPTVYASAPPSVAPTPVEAKASFFTFF